jgi:catechol 2,3-dioxygenase
MSAEPIHYGIAAPGYRLPAGIHLGSVHLQVADLDRSLEWYHRVLGVVSLDGSEVPSAGSPAHRTARLGIRGATRGLIELHEQRGASPVPRRGRLGLYHYAILLPDRAALGRFVRHLAEVGERAGMSDHLVSEAVYLSDPDGLGIEVYADRPRDEWGHEGGQLTMATLPLDVDKLLAAAGDAPWRGMPSGTALGHVHLFVGDLERAAAFYHVGLGLDQMVWSYPGALFLSAGGYHHHLGVNTWAQGAIAARPEDARLLEWTIEVPTLGDARAAIESVERSGGEVEAAPDGGVGRDPWGTAVRLRGLA